MQGVSLFDKNARHVWFSWQHPEIDLLAGARAWDFLTGASVRACKEAFAAALIEGHAVNFEVMGGVPKSWNLYRCRIEPVRDVAAIVRWHQLPENPLVLTQREREVLLAIVEDESPKKTARRLGIGVKTVETFRGILRRKTGCTGTAGLTRWAIRMGIIQA